ncbi:ABC transporter substrate-binding protein [Streptomyces sp. CA-106131]|uniref:ABC transporter substrate-binding protein n=1 Tax=Streptomyces sp. CA-106131 TaxID=3240045 RepID=UPI003D91A7B4
MATAAVLLAGCTSSTGSTGSGAFDANDKKISGTVNWVGWSPTVEEAPAYIAAFNKVYPNVKVNFKLTQYQDYGASLRPALASGAGPDVFDIQPGLITQQYGQYAIDLNGAAEQVLPGRKNKIAANGVHAFDYKGEVVGLSIGSGPAGQIWYNKDLFDKYGLTPPKTLDEWVHVCKVFKVGNVNCFVQGAQEEWVNQDVVQAIANSYSPGKFREAVDGKIKWTDPDLMAAFTTWKELFKDGVMQQGATGINAYPDADNMWLSGKAAMVNFGTWNLPRVKKSTLAPLVKALDPNGTVFAALPMAFPDVAGRGHPSTLFGDADYGIAVNRNSRNKAAATAFATWWTLTKEGQQYIADTLDEVPSLKGITPGPQDLVDPKTQSDVVAQVISEAQAVEEPRQIMYPDLLNALGDTMSAIATGQLSVADAVNRLQSVSDGIQR